MLQEGPEPVVGPERLVSYPVSGARHLTPPDGVAVASGGGVHLVVSNGIQAMRVDPNGVVMDPSPILVSEGGMDPDVAFDGENFLVGGRSRGRTVLGPAGPPDGSVLARRHRRVVDR